MIYSQLLKSVKMVCPEGCSIVLVCIGDTCSINKSAAIYAGGFILFFLTVAVITFLVLCYNRNKKIQNQKIVIVPTVLENTGDTITLHSVTVKKVDDKPISRFQSNVILPPINHKQYTGQQLKYTTKMFTM